MNSFVAHHPLPCLLAALLLGMTVKWVLDLFFLRARLFGLEHRLTQRDREIADLRHEHGRVLTDLKNRLTELDATQKAKTVLNTTLAARVGELADARARSAALDAEAGAARDRSAELERELAAGASVHEALQAAVQSRDAALDAAKVAATGIEAELAAANAALQKARRDADAAAKDRKVIDRELTAAKALDKELDAANAARAAADALLRQREIAIAELDRRMAEVQSAYDDAAVENGQIAKELAAVRVELVAAREAVGRLEKTAAKPAALGPDPAAVARIAALEDELGRAREARASVEAELGAVSESHARLEQELAAARAESARLEVRLEAQPEELAEVGRDLALTTMLSDMDQLSRERNELAAELAALKASGGAPVAPARAAAKAAPRNTESVEEFVAPCPQHLSEVKGIGPAFETRLYAVGIGSYWDLSRLTDRELAVILELDDAEAAKLDAPGIRADAARLAQETHSVGRRWSQEPPDDLEPIEGIGTAFEKKLYDAGLCTYAALAASSVERLEEICPGNPSRRPDYASWIEQARRRVEGQEG
ncbi:MAG: hypothetical protein DVB31_14910 [Verrucomicrobia bacterium]|nr:MAG: hypothetical protein DVB31_14910 [Verrucomicrobiota bacterium]